MLDKKYLEKLKKEDYIAWHSIVNDPMVVGTGSSGDLILPTIILIAVIGFLIGFVCC